MSGLKKGDYVFATKYSDGDPQDQWCVGFYAGPVFGKPGRHHVVDGNGKLFRGNGFRRCKKISAARGDYLLSRVSQIEKSGKSVWWWLRQPMEPKEAADD